MKSANTHSQIRKIIGHFLIIFSIIFFYQTNPAQTNWIAEIANQEGVPVSLVYAVIKQESTFNQRVVSPKGAIGLMQLMPNTARRFGVNPYNPIDNVRGGTRYLKWLLNTFGNRVDLALAGYNAGEGQVIKYGYQVPPYAETQNYVRKILQTLRANSSVTVVPGNKVLNLKKENELKINAVNRSTQTIPIQTKSRLEKPQTKSSFLF